MFCSIASTWVHDLALIPTMSNIPGIQTYRYNKKCSNDPSSSQPVIRLITPLHYSLRETPIDPTKYRRFNIWRNRRLFALFIIFTIDILVYFELPDLIDSFIYFILSYSAFSDYKLRLQLHIFKFGFFFSSVDLFVLKCFYCCDLSCI